MEKKYLVLSVLLVNLIGGIVVLVSTMSFEMVLRLHDAVNIIAILVIISGIIMFLQKLNVICAGLSVLSGLIIFMTMNGNMRIASSIIMFASCVLLFKNYQVLLKTVNIEEINTMGKKISKVVSENIDISKSSFVCLKCGKQYGRDSNFCPECGTIKPNEAENKKCPTCGNTITTDSAFCGNCGNKIGE